MVTLSWSLSNRLIPAPTEASGQDAPPTKGRKGPKGWCAGDLYRAGFTIALPVRSVDLTKPNTCVGFYRTESTLPLYIYAIPKISRASSGVATSRWSCRIRFTATSTISALLLSKTPRLR